MIGIFLLLLSINEIKECISDFSKVSRKKIPELIGQLLSGFLQILKLIQPISFSKRLLSYRKYFHVPFRRQICDKSSKSMDEIGPGVPDSCHIIYVTIDPNLYLMSGILKYCLLHKICDINTKFEGKIESSTNCLYIHQYEGIVLPINDKLSVSINNQIWLKYDVEANVKEFNLKSGSPNKRKPFGNDIIIRSSWYKQCRSNYRERLLELFSINNNRELRSEYLTLFEHVSNGTLRSVYKSSIFYQDIGDKMDLFKFLIAYELEMETQHNQSNPSNPFYQKWFEQTVIILILLVSLLQSDHPNETFQLKFKGSNFYIYVGDSIVIDRYIYFKRL